MFVLAGLIGTLVFGRSLAAAVAPAAPTANGRERAMMIAPAATMAFTGTTAKLLLFFFKTGLLVFGSGLVIVPFLKTQVVDQYHWLSNRQFLDSVAIGMISPGPVVITATFVGYLLNGVIGALAATIGIFSPPVLFTILATPILLRYYKNPRFAGFIRGVGVTVVGVLVGTTYLVGKEAIGDWLTAVIGIVSLVVIIVWKNLPEPFVVVAGGMIGLIAYQSIHPAWLLH